MNYSVLKITNNIADYPECEIDTKNNPELVSYVEDEMDIFIKDADGNFWPADDFFYQAEIKTFENTDCNYTECDCGKFFKTED